MSNPGSTSDPTILPQPPPDHRISISSPQFTNPKENRSKGSKVGQSQYFDENDESEANNGEDDNNEQEVLFQNLNHGDEKSSSSSDEGFYQNENISQKTGQGDHSRTTTLETSPLIQGQVNKSDKNNGLYPDLWLFSKSPMCWFTDSKKYPLSAAFTNYDFRQDFIGRIYLYKLLQAFLITIVAIIVEMMWTWTYKLKYGTPPYAQIIVNHFWIGFVSLPLYFTLIFIIRTFDIGKVPPLNYALFFILTTLLAWSCYGTSVGLFDYLPTAASAAPIISLSLTLSYALFCALIIPKKSIIRLDVTTTPQIYYSTLIISLTSSIFSWFIVNGILLSVGSFYQIQNVTDSLLFECGIICMPICAVILMYEVRNIRLLIEGSRAALYADDYSEVIFAFFHV